MNHLRLVSLIAAASLAVALASCSGPGGNAGAIAKPTPGPIVFTGTSIIDNVMTLPCDTDQTFTVSQSHYSGSFTLVPSSDNLSITPTTGTSATTFTASTDYGGNATWTVTATNSDGATGVLTVNFNNDDCG